MNGHEMRTDLLAERAKGAEALTWLGLPNPHKRVADNNNPLLLLDLSNKYDMPWIAVVKKSEFNERTRESMVNQCRTFVRQGRLVVDPKCKMLLGCLDYGIWDKPTQPRNFGRSAFLGHYDHLAALIYMIISIDQHTNPVPLSHGVAKQDLHMSPFNGATGGHALQQALLPRRNHRNR